MTPEGLTPKKYEPSQSDLNLLQKLGLPLCLKCLGASGGGGYVGSMLSF
jgi:hypothetical protein